MTTFDPSVWTSPQSDSWAPHWYISHSGSREVRVVPPGESWGLARSIHLIPSAEEIAALVECERIVRDNRHDLDHMAFLLDAALARLAAARKERGA